MQERLTVCGKSYCILRLLGHGKGGYSYLAEREGSLAVLKQIHHEPCDYYTFGNKIEAELRDYDRLRGAGIRIPEMLAIDMEQERIVKTYIEGPTVFDLVKEGASAEAYLPQVRAMAAQARDAGLNIDYFPTNFVVRDEQLWYVDYECNDYMEEWDFEHWGVKYWSRTPEFEEYLRRNQNEGEGIEKPMQFGMPTLIENRTLEDNAALCGELGLRFIELNMNFPEYQVERLEHTDTLKRLAEKTGIYYTIHLDENMNIADFNRLVSEAYLETVRRTIAAAKELIPLRDRFEDRSQPMILNMHMNHGIFITLPDRKVQMYKRDFDVYMRSITRFRSLCEEWIEGSDLLIAVENTDGFRDYEKKAVEYLLDSPVFGLTWDIGHSKATGETDVPYIMEHRNRLVHFHIHDGTEKPPRNHLALGDGEIVLADRLGLAKERNARCVLETKTIAALRRSVQWLRTRGEM